MNIIIHPPEDPEALTQLALRLFMQAAAALLLKENEPTGQQRPV